MSNIQKDNRKALPKFFLIVLASAVFGGVLGFASGWMGASGRAETLAAGLRFLIEQVVPWAIPAVSLILLIAAVRRYRSAKRRFAAWDGEDEDAIDGADTSLSWALLLTSVILILNYFLLSASYYCGTVAGGIVLAAGFVLAVVAVILLQQKVVDLTRRMNPEKQGSVYDLKFRKKWLESCDEAEQRQMGQAAMRAYTSAVLTCQILWVALVILDFIYGFGLLPAFVVLLLLGVLQVSYTLECIRLSGKGNRSL